ncbi:hypothetical protein QVD17_36100 [Tagetes erecta]|uniref:Uncharacterized protein n=1 Tax=Tagetes erecta TaxID=13708 RepID=A0AAD8JTR8_TARER|nr:hypothetical protein QVD17_36100 [Tagetes erecta]
MHSRNEIQLRSFSRRRHRCMTLLLQVKYLETTIRSFQLMELMSWASLVLVTPGIDTWGYGSRKYLLGQLYGLLTETLHSAIP